ncbi:DUF1471 domain-containing protein [Pantoea stewartii]|uniref:YdgH/BhsA/McbA-like domain-containing protein n=1 Tax=Pantoea stewartii TaxID=66269 RepID=A0AB34VEJ2_9GAMM|nr:DUF1471 domain-containing protein [Pantoea stewartii]KTS72240.1 hypothetical protein RSA30_15595 [Pantoea stewartii]KTS97668.1 hypothetical protein RSA13_11295 [Pantoea stewartii]KTT05807.1 hypothetical protein RSA36_19380 [Pantoea stewartii]
MKKVLMIYSCVSLALVSLSTQASTELSSMNRREVIGHVSVTGEDNLDSLTSALSKKADAAGATGFYITSAGGKNKLHGSAVILK